MRHPDSIDLNADVGEGFATDAELVPLVSSVNIACGAHAGDIETMRRTVALAVRHGAAIGAHPGFADRENFGRRERPIAPAEAAALVIAQARLLESVARGLGARVGHIKLHGALYNMASRDPVLAAAIASAMAEAGRASGASWTLVALAGSPLLSIARGLGLTVAGEGFADRTYRGDGTLTPRSEAGSVIDDEAAAAQQAVRMAREGRVRTADGADLAIAADTLCIHGDGPHAVSLATRIRDGLLQAGITLKPYA
jgi:UPF0271 protein